MTHRTAFKLSMLLAFCLAAPLAPAAEGSGEVARFVTLTVSNAEQEIIALGQRLQMLRSASGKSYTVEFQSAQGRSEQFPAIAAVLVRSKVDVIVAAGNAPAFAAKKATRSIPIVVWAAHDAVGTGLASSLARPDGLLMLTDDVTFVGWKHVNEFAQSNHVPTVCEFGVLVDAGCLVSYGPEFDEFTECVARQADRIVKGAKPGVLPFEQPTRFELVVNRKTAAALGITIPQDILRQATRVFD